MLIKGELSTELAKLNLFLWKIILKNSGISQAPGIQNPGFLTNFHFCQNYQSGHPD